MEPLIIKGNSHIDERGMLSFNNSFNASEIKRIYVIENKSLDIKRGWTGHTQEKRWFSAISGAFTLQVIKIDDWQNPSKNLKPIKFIISEDKLAILLVPPGFVTMIKANTENAKLLVMADYLLGETNDEYRFPIDYFKF